MSQPIIKDGFDLVTEVRLLRWEVNASATISTTTTLPASEEAKKPYRDWLHDIIRENGFCEDSKENVYAEFGGFGGLTSWARQNGVLFELRAQAVVFTKA